MSAAATAWDPRQYAQFSGERLRPAVDLLGRVMADAPARVADLGCGGGEATRLIAARWPDASIVAVDGSREMLERGHAAGPASARWVEADVAAWAPDGPMDVIFSNAALHWLPSHETLFPRLLSHLAAGGVLAVQMPRQNAAPTHVAIRELAAEAPFRDHLEGVQAFAPVAPAEWFHRLLNGKAQGLDIWETVYLHRLQGPDPVVRWTKGSVLRPYLAALPEALRSDFEAAYAERMREAYPPEPDGGTLLGYRRLFLVAVV